MPGVVHPTPTMKHTTANASKVFDKTGLHAFRRLIKIGCHDAGGGWYVERRVKTAAGTVVGGSPNDLRRES
jgi:hypothetical protein